MSDLRNQLDSARREYESIRYPGDLGAEILPPLRHTTRRIWNFAAVAAIAAMVVLAVRLRMVGRDPLDGTVGTGEEEVVELSLGNVPAVSVLELSAGTDLTPDAPGFSFSAPSFSIIADEQPDETSTTQETVL